MARKTPSDIGAARSAVREEIAALLYHPDPEVLAALVENPRLEEDHLCLLLERKDLPGTLLEEIARQKHWRGSYRVKRGLAFHPHTPRLVAMRLARQLFLMDLVKLSMLSTVPAELRRVAEELILARLPQLPLGQKLALARRGPARVVGRLLAEGNPQVVPLALDNAFLTEAQVLKVLFVSNLPARVVTAIASHRKWSQLYNVRVALVRSPATPLARVLSFLPDLTVRDLKDLCEQPTLSENLRGYLRHQIAQRLVPEGRATTRRAK